MITKTKLATCDVCKQEREFEHGELPSNWVDVLFHKRVGDNGYELHFLDLCLGCQEKALAALGVKP